MISSRFDSSRKKKEKGKRGKKKLNNNWTTREKSIRSLVHRSHERRRTDTCSSSSWISRSTAKIINDNRRPSWEIAASSTIYPSRFVLSLHFASNHLFNGRMPKTRGKEIPHFSLRASIVLDLFFSFNLQLANAWGERVEERRSKRKKPVSPLLHPQSLLPCVCVCVCVLVHTGEGARVYHHMS